MNIVSMIATATATATVFDFGNDDPSAVDTNRIIIELVITMVKTLGKRRMDLNRWEKQHIILPDEPTKEDLANHKQEIE